MALSLALSIPSEEEETSGTTFYVIRLLVRSEEREEERLVRRRYSEFHRLYKALGPAAVGMAAAFPPKLMGKLSGEVKKKRREGLEAFMRELVAAIMSPFVKATVYEFLGLEASQGRALPESGAGSSSPLSPSQESFAPRTQGAWADSFMRADPLAAAPVSPSPASPTTPLQADGMVKGSPGVGAVSSPVPSPPCPPKPPQAPVFLNQTDRAPTAYPSSGEGLREAIMRRDLRAVRHLLSTSPELALYTDRQAESMLHLAAIFNQGEIAVALLEAGARLDTTNSHRETPLEIAQPALKKRLLECQKRLESRRLA